MNETPISDVAANSTPIPGQTQGSAAPSATPHEPTSIGLRTPMRSDSRPAATLSQHRQKRVQTHQRADDQRRRADATARTARR